jgi:cyclase
MNDALGADVPRRVHRPRVIPVLLLHGNGLLYKTLKFRKPKYVGDPRVAVKIFNDKGVDELFLLDIEATLDGRAPNYALLEEIAGEAFMPVGYGGGLANLEQIRRVLRLGVEKVVLNSSVIGDEGLVTEAARAFGSQSVVGAIDVKHKRLRGYRVHTRSGSVDTRRCPVATAQQLVSAGAGELLVNSIDRDGTFAGYDLELTRQVARAVNVPVVACGGARDQADLAQAIRAGASAAAAGSLFVFQLPHRAVLITYPSEEELSALFARG